MRTVLRRFWFPVTVGIGVGVTAFSPEEARLLADEGLAYLPAGASLLELVVDVDVRDLDQRHVAPNMGPCNLRGVWYPHVRAISGPSRRSSEPLRSR